MSGPREVIRLRLPTVAGEFEARAFEVPSGYVYLALVRGDVANGTSVLTRLHSECLTGDALGSLRCDCGIQLRQGLRAIAAEDRGIVVYATGHEGRGIGLVNKLRAYLLQDDGADTLDANQALGLPVDDRDYREAAAVLAACGVRSVRLLTNNPEKARALAAEGITVEAVVPLHSAPHLRNVSYLRAKRDRLGHLAPPELPDGPATVADPTSLLGEVKAPPHRPYVVLKFAQTLDGRIATGTGDSRWISGEEERRLSHALRAACDAVVVGAGTVASDDPRLTVRLVPGNSPIRVVLDSTLRISPTAAVLDDSAPTVVLTSDRAPARRRLAVRRLGAGVEVVPSSREGIDLRAALRRLRDRGIATLLVEGGARVITSFLRERLADRLVVSIAPLVLGTGTEAVGDLGAGRVAEGLPLANRSAHVVGRDLLMAGDVAEPEPPERASGRAASDAGTNRQGTARPTAG